MIYFIQAESGGPIKIGVSGDTDRRLRQIQQHSPARLRVLATAPGGPVEEKALHLRFADWRVRGEWFRGDCPPLLEVIQNPDRVAELCHIPPPRSFTKQALLRCLEDAIAEIRRAIGALEEDDYASASDSFLRVADRFASVGAHPFQTKSNDPPAHLAVGARTGRNERSVPNDGGSDE